jgi:AcrR family transcriptional regulator
VPKVPSGHLEARRESIVEAACRVFSNRGIRSATMAEVAAEAGISPGAIYRYFPSKDDLARYCMTEKAALIKYRWLLEGPDAHDPRKEMGELSRLTFAAISEPDERMGTVLFLEQLLAAVRDDDEETLKDMRAEHHSVAAGLRARIEAARAAGQFAEYIDPERLSQALLSFYWGSRISVLLDPSTPISSNAEQIMLLMERSAESGR